MMSFQYSKISYRKTCDRLYASLEIGYHYDGNYAKLVEDEVCSSIVRLLFVLPTL